MRNSIIAVNVRTGEVVEVKSPLVEFAVPDESQLLVEELAERAIRGQDVQHLLRQQRRAGIRPVAAGAIRRRLRGRNQVTLWG